MIRSIPLLYFVLILPGYRALVGLVDRTLYYPEMMYISGVWSVTLLCLTISVSPLLTIIRTLGFGIKLGQWFMKRRKHFGLASFIYAATHTLHYVFYTGSFDLILSESIQFEIALGWVAFFVLIALALTSNKASTHKLGRNWKRLHNLIYPSIALSLFHWLLFDAFTKELYFWFGCFVLIKVIHLVIHPIPRLKHV